MSAPEPEAAERRPRGVDLALLLRLLRWARPHRRAFGTSFAVLVALFAVQLTGPWIWRRAIDGPVAAAARRRADPEAVGAPADALDAFWGYVALYAVVLAAGAALRWLEVAQLARTGQRVVADIRTELFAHLQRLDLAFFDARPTGALVTRVTGDVENLSEMFTSGLVVLLFDLCKVAVVLAVLFVLHWPLALVVLALTPILAVTSHVFRGGAREAYRTVRRRHARVNGYLQEVLSGIRVVQMFGREERTATRFGAVLERYLDAHRRSILLFALFFPALALGISVIEASTLWVGGAALARGGLTLGLFLQFWLYLELLVAPIRDLGERYNVLQAAFASAERLFAILDTRPSIAGPPAAAVASAALAVEPGARSGVHVRFEHVSFSYDGRTPVLEDVSFEIPPGATVAVVGATGAGKSTLVNLLLRFYDPVVGRITLDGVDLRDVPLATLRAAVAPVLQEDFLFAGSLRENLTLGRDVAPAALERALDASRARALVERLPGGLDARVAERGANLSAGERQLLAMARALAGDAPLVVLDEATASVDSATEAEIELATARLLAGRGALVVAHRLSTVRRADRILVLHRGRVREAGTHAELLARGDLYRRLYALQFAGAGPALS